MPRGYRNVVRRFGNAPNLMIKAIAERERFPMPSFLRYYAAFAFATMPPAHILTTLALVMLDR
jgi:Na+/H+ antiporter NhaD/arsenite permease-like protein